MNLLKNSLSGMGQFILTALLTFVSIPLFISKLGEQAYGIFSIVTLAGNLNVFANLGLNTALLKFLSQQGRSQESNYDILVTICLIILLLTPLSALAIYFEEYILMHLMGVPPAMYGQVSSLYKLILISNFIVLVGQTFTTVLDSLQKVYLTNLLQFVYNLLYWLGLIACVVLGYGLSELGMVILAAACIWFLLVYIQTTRIWGGIKGRGLGTHFRRIASKQFQLSSRMYAAGVLNFLFEPLTKILVSRFIGVTEVGYLDIAYRIKAQFWGLISKATYPLYPKLAKEQDSGVITRLVTTYQFVILLIVLPTILFVFCFMDTILNFWIGNVDPMINEGTKWITIANLLGTLAIPPYYFLLSSKHAHKVVHLQVINVVLNTLIILSSYSYLGFYSVIIGNATAITGSLLASLFFQSKLIPFSDIKSFISRLKSFSLQF